MRGNIICHILRVHGEHPHDAFIELGEVDHTKAAAFSSARCRPTKLTHPAGATNDFPGLRLINQVLLKLLILVVRQVVSHESGKELRFDEAYHQTYYTATP